MADEKAQREQNKVFTQGDAAAEDAAQPLQKGTQPAHQRMPINVPGLPGPNEMPPEMRAGAGDDDLGFKIPVNSVPLASRGMCYAGTSLQGYTHINVKGMTAKEEDILTSDAYRKDGTIITQLLRSCITDPVNPSEMLVGDRSALLIALRIMGYGEDYTIEVECPSCEVKQEHTFDLRELPVRFLDLDPDLPGQNVFSCVLPVSKKQVAFRFFTGHDEEKMTREQQQTRAKRKKHGLRQDNIVTSRYMRQLVSVDGRTDPGFIARFVNNMPARDSRYLRKYIADHEPGMEMQDVITCEECGEAKEVDVDIGPAFFWPDD